MCVEVGLIHRKEIQNVINHLSVLTLEIPPFLLHHFIKLPMCLLRDWSTNLSHSASPWILVDIYSLHQHHDTRHRSSTLDTPYHSWDPTSCWGSLKDREVLYSLEEDCRVKSEGSTSASATVETVDPNQRQNASMNLHEREVLSWDVK